MWFVLILLIIVVLVLVFACSQYIFIPTYDSVDLDYFLSHANNGDLIFMSGTTMTEHLIKLFTGCQFSHVGFLFRETHPETGKNILYIYDVDVGQGVKDGVRVMPVNDKFDRYKGEKICGWRKYKGKRPELQDILNNIKKNIDLPFDNNMTSYFLPFKPNSGVFCSEFIIMLMLELNMIDKNVVQQNLFHHYTPAFFYYLFPMYSKVRVLKFM